MNWNAFDLNLLVVFDTVIEEKNLTRAGQRLGMSQSAVSHALARLRHMLKDELFVRTPEGMSPTPRAERMIEPVRAALQELRITLEADAFDAAQSSRSFVIAANNYGARAVVPKLVRKAAALAPSVLIEARPIGRLPIFDQLDSGAVELVLGPLGDGGDRFKCASLLEDDYVVILSNQHPVLAEPDLSIEQFSSLPHIIVTSSGDDTQFIDEALAEHGLARRIYAKITLHSLISVLIASKALAVVPRRVAADLVAISSVAMRPLPFASPRITLSMIWHRRLDNQPAHRWLRETMRAAVDGA
jgi:DNA-binding transcriptional LysR family regulator